MLIVVATLSSLQTSSVENRGLNKQTKNHSGKMSDKPDYRNFMTEAGNGLAWDGFTGFKVGGDSMENTFAVLS